MIPDHIVEAALDANRKELGHRNTLEYFRGLCPVEYEIAMKSMTAALEAAAPMMREQWTNELASAIAQANDAAWRSTHVLPQPPKESSQPTAVTDGKENV
jgi:hypothetical protein